MDRDTVIALAREAEQYANTFCESIGDTEHNHWFDAYNERFAALVEGHLKSQGYRQCAIGQRTTQFCGVLEEGVKAEIRERLLDEVGDAIRREREECARIAENQWEIPGTQRRTAERCAAAIRSRT